MHPPAPWRSVGQGWFSVFRVRDAAVRPDGLYVAGFVAYEPGSTLDYSELLVARVLLAPRQPRVEVTDIWVDSVESRDGGRELWAIPKGLGRFTRTSRRAGPVVRTDWAGALEDRPVASASFGDVSRVAPRVPFRSATRQPGLDGGPEREARFSGSARVLACRGSWQIAPEGPLRWLRGQRRLASVRVTDFRMSFG